MLKIEHAFEVTKACSPGSKILGLRIRIGDDIERDGACGWRVGLVLRNSHSLRDEEDDWLAETIAETVQEG